jgi:predicted flap endonuclease-1-like 5' DNA nuclease
MSADAELTPRIGGVAQRALAAEGIHRYADLAGRGEKEILALHGVGPKAVRILAEELAARGQSFAPER